jgi:hypothetical protein
VPAEFRPVNVSFHPDSPAADHYRRRLAAPGLLDEAIAAGFSPNVGNDLHFFGGKTIPALTFVNLYVGAASAWNAGDMSQIDHAFGGAMSDVGLNNMLAQYFGGTAPTTSMLPSQVLGDPAPAQVFKDTIEGWVTARHGAGQLPGGQFATTVYCFMLPRGAVLFDALSTDPPGGADSQHGLGGYHGSVHAGADKVYYAVGVFSEGANGIVAFDQPWKNVVATFYHELVEARTDADVEDAAAAGSFSAGSRFLGWYSPKAGEIGDIPMSEAGAALNKVMVEVPLTGGAGTVPIQLMWSNTVHGPEGAVSTPEAPSGAGNPGQAGNPGGGHHHKPHPVH